MASQHATARHGEWLRPPWTVLLVVAVGIVAGAVGFVYGISLIVDRDDASVQADTGLSSGGLVAYGIGAMAVGAILVAAALWLAGGGKAARWVVGWFVLLHLFQGLAIVFQWYEVSPWEGVSSIVVSAIALYLLFVNRSSRSYYARR